MDQKTTMPLEFSTVARSVESAFTRGIASGLRRSFRVPTQRDSGGGAAAGTGAPSPHPPHPSSRGGVHQGRRRAGAGGEAEDAGPKAHQLLRLRRRVPKAHRLLWLRRRVVPLERVEECLHGGQERRTSGFLHCRISSMGVAATTAMTGAPRKEHKRRTLKYLNNARSTGSPEFSLQVFSLLFLKTIFRRFGCVITVGSQYWMRLVRLNYFDVQFVIHTIGLHDKNRNSASL